MLPEARSVRDFPGSWFKNKRKGRPDLQSHRVGDMPSRVTGHRRERMTLCFAVDPKGGRCMSSSSVLIDFSHTVFFYSSCPFFMMHLILITSHSIMPRHAMVDRGSS